jgi:hypothetical protein
MVRSPGPNASILERKAEAIVPCRALGEHAHAKVALAAGASRREETTDALELLGRESPASQPRSKLAQRILGMPVFSQSDQATKQVLRQASQQLLRFSHFRHEPSAAHNFGRGRGAEKRAKLCPL